MQPALPMWATSYAFVKICQNFFPWLVGPMHGEDFVDIEVPEHWRRVLFFLPEFVRVPQTATAERCRFLESAQCASVCVNICKAPSQAWLSGDFGMPVHIEPNYDDLSCRWRFGVTPPPLLEDDAVKVPALGVGEGWGAALGNLEEADLGGRSGRHKCTHKSQNVRFGTSLFVFVDCFFF